MKFAAFRALEGAEVFVRPDRVHVVKTATTVHEGETIEVTQICLVGEAGGYILVRARPEVVVRELQDASR